MWQCDMSTFTCLTYFSNILTLENSCTWDIALSTSLSIYLLKVDFCGKLNLNASLGIRMLLIREIGHWWSGWNLYSTIRVTKHKNLKKKF